MTLQIQDTLLYRGKKYSIVFHQGEGLFSPWALGFQPTALHSGCWRGTIARYKTRQGQLFLDQLTIGDRNEFYPEINGVFPELSRHHSATYKNLDRPVPFSGYLRIGRGYIGPLEPIIWKEAEDFQETLDIYFAEGRIQEVQSCPKTLPKDPHPATG